MELKGWKGYWACVDGQTVVVEAPYQRRNDADVVRVGGDLAKDVQEQLPVAPLGWACWED